VAYCLLDATTSSFLLRDDARLRVRINALGPSETLPDGSFVRGEPVHGFERLAAGKRRTDLETSGAGDLLLPQ
jgi:hypothetical protein